MSTYKEYKKLDLPQIADEIRKFWEEEEIFKKSIENREGEPPFVFFEGPPSANGLPGIHHVMARSIKDIFCRFKTLKGFQVERKAGWDTHGLPVELGVEKDLGITKEDIGTKITIEEYNQECRRAVMKYTDIWNDLTRKMGYWVDTDSPYVTYENKYIESVWWLLKQLHQKDMMYKGYTIQPYSPAAGTGLSSHELNQPGCYRDVKDTTVVAQFAIKEESKGQLNPFLTGEANDEMFFLAWTTTPWTLPSNTALAVGPKIDYVIVNTFNPYTFKAVTLLLAENLLAKHFKAEMEGEDLASYEPGAKNIPYQIIGKCKGSDLVGMRYEQLLPWAQPFEGAENAFQVIKGDFVTTEDGTGIVHIAPTFGADDAKVAQDAGVPPMLVLDENENAVPLVDLQGRFVKQTGKWAGKYVKNEYYASGEAPDKSVDVEIAIQLKEENRAFKVEKYEHSYPHCWRTDKPVLYYPLDSWFIRATRAKERMMELNSTINWKPKATGEGRFGNWLENLNDWNLSRSRFWGIPIPVWRTEDGSEQICIGSVEELKNECKKAVEAGLMDKSPLEEFEPGNMDEENYNLFDLHKNEVDKIVLLSAKGQPMKREADLIDVWFDSGSMPYAQWHYPFENKDKIDNGLSYPADFIAEGVDQTRGWFYTLHAIGTMCFDSVAYKNVISNGLVLDKNGQKMSKRLGNAVDPFATLSVYGPDATRWYMITNAQPWDNLKFDIDGIIEVQRKFFGTLYNTYGFFSLYANLDVFTFWESEIPMSERTELDQWIISKLNTLIEKVEDALNSFEPTRAGRLIQDFVIDDLSNWYVRLCRRRFWKGDMNKDKLAAYQTLYTCLEKVAIIMSPIAPFYSDRLFKDLNKTTKRYKEESVHLVDYPKVNQEHIDTDLEEKMSIAQKLSSMVLSLRKKEKIKVRQPLQRMMVPGKSPEFNRQLKEIEHVILSEVNVKELEIIGPDNNILVKKIKPNFKTIGPKYGKQMKQIAAMVNSWGANEIAEIEANQSWSGEVDGASVELDMKDFVIETDDIPGWLVQSEDGYTVALDVNISEDLRNEGLSRELVNRIQNLRKEADFELTDRIDVKLLKSSEISEAVNDNLNYICSETLCDSLKLVDELEGTELDLGDGIITQIKIQKN